MNSTSHGMSSPSPIVPGEDPEQWETFQKEMLADIAPVGAMEIELADRVALLLWRLRRVTKYESAMIATPVEETIEIDIDPMDSSPGPRTDKTIREDLKREEESVVDFRRLADLFDKFLRADDKQSFSGSEAFSIFEMLEVMESEFDNDEFKVIIERISNAGFEVASESFFMAIGIPETDYGNAKIWSGWTAALVRKGMLQIANAAKMTLGPFLAKLKQFVQEVVVGREECFRKLTKELEEWNLAHEKNETVSRNRRMVPACYEKVIRYEAHLARQLAQTLHQLERLQVLRSDNPPVPPLALDVLVQSEGERQ